MDLPRYLLSFDPGGGSRTWAYALSVVRRGGNKLFYRPISCGFAPIIEDLSAPDVRPLISFRDHLLSQIAPSARVDLVAERFIGRGFSKKIAETIPFALGVWTTLWGSRGQVNMIMAANWKVKLEKEKSLLVGKNYKIEEPWFQRWWESWFSVRNPIERTAHVQDACAIGLWWWRYKLGVDCRLF